MRLLIALIISFQFISAPVLARTGEHASFSVHQHLLQAMAKIEARLFEQTLRDGLDKLSQDGIFKMPGVSEESKKLIGENVRPSFKEVSQGQWEFKSKGDKLHFSSSDLYLGRLYVNGVPVIFKDVPLEKFRGDIEKLLSKKTSFIKFIINNTFVIQDAEAIGLFLVAIIATALVAAIVGYVMPAMREKKIAAMKKLNEISRELDADAMACEEAASDSDQYDKTFKLASGVSSASLTSVATTSGALEYAVRAKIESNDKDFDQAGCYQAMSEAGNKIDLEIPVLSANEIIRMEALVVGSQSNKDVEPKTAAYNICNSLGRLGPCMQQFMGRHVNDSDLSSFKESAEHNYYNYYRKASSRQ